MRKLILFTVCAGMVLLSATGLSRNFSPTPLKLSAPLCVGYNSDNLENPELSFPVTVSGTQATVMLALFTKNRARATMDLQGGSLGWHYVNKVDTCIYISGPYFFEIGTHDITWDGKDKNGHHYLYMDYTYYVWGYDNTSAGTDVVNYISPIEFSGTHIQTRESEGSPLAQPIFFSGLLPSGYSSEPVRVIRGKWVVGNDPEDYTLLETTAYRTSGEAPRLALNPAEYWRYFYTESIQPGSLVLRKWRWVPNDTAILETVWCDSGEVSFPTEFPESQPLNGGPVSDEGYLIFANVWEDGGWRSGVICADINDGTRLRTIDLSRWWNSAPDTGYGPESLELARTEQESYLFCTSPASCVYQMIAPYAEYAWDIVRWVNGNGDGVGDKNFRPDSPNPWRCNDPAAPPYPPSLSPDANLFSLFAASGLSAASFGAFAPDGAGLGYFTIPGMENGNIQALRIIDYGSAFDGIYFGGVDAKGDGIGIRYIAYDSIRGEVQERADAFGRIRIYNPYDGAALNPGSKMHITWDGDVPSACRIEFSADGGITWSVIVDSIESVKGVYLWTVPPVNSTRCQIRFSDITGTDPYSSTSGYFTITGKTDVNDALPRALTISNFPNPFNPSTVITFTLPRPGTISLVVHDITGRKVTDLARGFHAEGEHTVVWNAANCASGVYFCVLKTAKSVETRKMLLMR